MAAAFRRGFSKQHRDAPKTGKSHERVDHAAEHPDLTAEEKSDAVEAEQSHASPVERADDDKDQRDLIDEHSVSSFVWIHRR